MCNSEKTYRNINEDLKVMAWWFNGKASTFQIDQCSIPG